MLKQVNTAAVAEGCDPAKIAEEAGYVPQPPNLDSPAASFLSRVAASATAGYTHTFSGGEQARFEFPRGIQAFQDLGKKITNLSEKGEMIEGSILLVTQTSVEPKMSEEEVRWLAENAGLEFVHLTGGLMEAFLLAMNREPVRMVEQGKEPSPATS